MGSAPNFTLYQELSDFRKSNQTDFSLALGSELGDLYPSKFNNTFTFIGKNNKIFGTLDADADADEIELMIRRTIASFNELDIKAPEIKFIDLDEETLIPMSELYEFDDADIEFKVLSSTESASSDYEISNGTLFLRKGTEYGHRDITIGAKHPDKDTWLTKDISVINLPEDGTDDFEYSSLEESNFEWISGGDAEWTIDSGNSFSGKSSLRSGRILYGQTSEVSVAVNFDTPSAITFAYRTSSYYEGNEEWYIGDFLNFYVDSVNFWNSGSFYLWGGINDWRLVTTYLDEGPHNLKWQYSKNTYTYSGDDAVWIDMVYIPGAFPVGTPLEYENKINDLSLDVYPNPFNPVTTFSFSLTNSSKVRLTVFDTAGRTVRKLIDGYMPSGEHRSSFDGSDLSGGIYFTILETPYSRLVKKIVLTK